VDEKERILNKLLTNRKMKQSEMKFIAQSLSRTQDLIDSICEVMDDEGDAQPAVIHIKIPHTRDSTYGVISEMCGVQICYLSNNHIKEKEIRFITNSTGKRHRFCLEVAFEFLCKLIPWCDLVITH
jgi:hypothetical protein